MHESALETCSAVLYPPFFLGLNLKWFVFTCFSCLVKTHWSIIQKHLQIQVQNKCPVCDCVCVVSFLYKSHFCHSSAGGWWSLWDWSEPIWPEEATMGCTTPSRSLWSSFRLVLFWRWAWKVAASCNTTYLLHFEGIGCSLPPVCWPRFLPWLGCDCGSHEMADKPHFVRGCDWF